MEKDKLLALTYEAMWDLAATMGPDEANVLVDEWCEVHLQRDEELRLQSETTRRRKRSPAASFTMGDFGMICRSCLKHREDCECDTT